MKAMYVGAAVAGAMLLAAAGPKPDRAAISIWAKQPTLEQSMAALPETARRIESGGYAAMRCKVAADTTLANCQLLRETPSSAGFGQALLALAPEYRMKSLADGGLAPGSEVVTQLDTLRFDKPSDWQRKPTADDLLVVWPKAAWARGVGGKAVIQCFVSVQGGLYECVVTSESPVGENFGSAGIALTPQFLMKPATLKGVPVISLVRIPLVFSMPSGLEPASNFGARQTVAPAMAWPEAPTYAAVAAAYPKKARANNVAGRATLNCNFSKDGHITSCNTVAEEPRGQGFADAAKLLAKQFRAFPTTSTGATLAGAGVQLPVTFDLAMLTGATPVIGKAQWAGLPSAEDTRAAFAKVETGHGTVRVVLACVVQQGGGVSDCKVTREEPAGIGVGPAALALTPRFRLSTWTNEGMPTVGGTINIPLRYEGGDAPQTPAKP